ncbi:MAG: hypothetical protein RQ729_11110 [Wenzhouxiangellaceae bacterium]|nr:hypothetical protein [Wenzhouxiangellaceae bacterium]
MFTNTATHGGSATLSIGSAARSLAAALLIGLTLVASAQAQPQLTVTPITWDVVGLDSNRPLTEGPSLFPVAAQVCNIGSADTGGLTVDMTWDGPDSDTGTAMDWIDFRPGSLTSLKFAPLAPGECVDAYYEIEVQRGAGAFDQSRPYRITATDGSVTGVSPTPRQIYVERLVSQNRNVTQTIRWGQQADGSDWQFLGAGGSLNLVVGETYFIELTTATATAYEQVESFIALSNTIFQILQVDTEYSVRNFNPPVADPNPSLYADGCSWDPDPNSPNYLSCLSVGKLGGNITTVYEINIISGGGENTTLEALIYDFSGSSFHYNTDLVDSPGDVTVIDPVTSATFAKRFVPSTIALGETSTLRFTIGNPNPVAISGYGFVDNLPAGMFVASPTVTSSSCGGTVTAAAGASQVAFAGGAIGASSSCTVLVEVTVPDGQSAADYLNTSEFLTIGGDPTELTAQATLTVTAEPPPPLDCDVFQADAQGNLPDLAEWTAFDNATGPTPTFQYSPGVASASLGTGLTSSLDVGGLELQLFATAVGQDLAAARAANAYFDFLLDTTGIDELRFSFEVYRQNGNAPEFVALDYGPVDGTLQFDKSFNVPNQNARPGANNFFSGQLTTNLNPSGFTRFRVYAYNATNQTNQSARIIDPLFEGIGEICREPVGDPPPPPSIAKRFIETGSATTVPTADVNEPVRLRFTLINNSATESLTGVTFSDTLPAGMVADGGSLVNTTCGGTWSLDTSGDDDVLSLTDGLLAAGGSCTLDVTVSSDAVGPNLNLSDPIDSNETLAGNSADATLAIVPPPPPASLAKRFEANPLLDGSDISTLTFIVTNNDPARAISQVAFTDTLPSGMVVAANPAASTAGCGSPTFSPVAGSGSVSFVGGSIAASGVCVATVNVAVNPAQVPAQFVNQSSVVSHVFNSVTITGNDAQATLLVDNPIPSLSFLKQVGRTDDQNGAWSNYITLGEGESLYYKFIIENTGETVLTGIGLSDPNVVTTSCNWTDPLPVASFANPEAHITTCIVGPLPAVAGTTVNTATATAVGGLEATDTATYETADVAAQFLNIPTVFSPGQVVTGLELQCASNGPAAALNAFCVPTVDVGVISNVACTPTSPQALLSVEASILCTFDYTAPGAPGGSNAPDGRITFEGATGADNDGNLLNNQDLELADLVDAVDDVAGRLTGSVGQTFDLSANDDVGTVFSVLSGGATSCANTSINPSTGVATFDVGSGCVIEYQLCAASPNASVCDTATLTVTATQNAEPELSISKVADPSQFTVGQPADYVLTVTNSGSAATTEVAIITDSIPAGLNPGTMPSGCLLNSGTVACTIAAGLGFSAPNNRVQFVIPVTPTAITPPNQPLVNTASVRGGGDPDCTDPNITAKCNSTVETPVLGPNFAIVKTASAASFVVGQPASYTLTVTNTGNAATTAAATVSDSIPAGLNPGTLPSGCSLNSGTVTCTIAAGLGFNAPNNRVQFVIPVTPTVAAATSVTNTATLSGGGDPDCNGTGDCTSTVENPVLRPELSLAKTANPQTFTVGEIASYTLTVTNQGTAETTASAVITDFIPANLQIGILPAGCERTLQTVNCAIPAGLSSTAPINTASFTIPVIPTAQAVSPLVNTAFASGGGDPACPEADRCNATTSNPLDRAAAITLTKEAALEDANGNALADAGEFIDYTLTATNSGSVDLVNVSISDPRLATLECNPVQPADLAMGDQLVCTGRYQVTVGDIDANGAVINTATATGTDPGPNPEVPDDDRPVTDDDTTSTGVCTLDSGAIRGTVWEDLQRDGSIDAGERRFPSFLTLGVPGSAPNDLLLTTAELNGEYRFDEVVPGTYELRILEAFLGNNFGLYAIESVVRSVTVTRCGEVVENFNFGPPLDGVVGDFVWFDADQNSAVNEFRDGNGNGVLDRQERGTNFLANDFEWVDLNGNGAPNDGEFRRCGLTNVAVQVFDADTNQSVGTAMTNLRGEWFLRGLDLDRRYSATVDLDNLDNLVTAREFQQSGLCRILDQSALPAASKDRQGVRAASPAVNAVIAQPAVAGCGATRALLQTSPLLTSQAPDYDRLDFGVVCATGGTLGLVKELTANADEDASGSVTLDDTLTYTITATNTGVITLANVVVSDDRITPSTETCATLDAGETCVLEGTYVVTQADVDAGQILNTATADSDETDEQVTDLRTPLRGPVPVPLSPVWMVLMALLLLAMARRHVRSRPRVLSVR